MNWLFELPLFMLAAIIGGQFCKRIHISPLIGEISAGILMALVFALVGAHHDEHLLHVFAELGVIFILFVIGMETNIKEIINVGKPALAVALAGVVLPFLSGLGVGMYYGWTMPITLFVSASLVATSITVSARAFIDLDFVQHRSSQIVLGAAIIDDILGLLVLTFVISTVSAEGGALSTKLIKIGLFFVLIMPFVWFFVPKILNRLSKIFGLETRGVLTVATLLLIAYSAHWTGLAPIVGAFFMGMVLSFNRDEHAEHFVNPFYLVLAPIFFFSIGFMVDLSSFVDGLAIALILTTLGILGKLIGGLIGGMPFGIPFKESLLIGVAMVPRGEVGLIIAGIGKAMGVVDDTLFAAVAFMCLATTFLPPFILPKLINAVKNENVRSAT